MKPSSATAAYSATKAKSDTSDTVNLASEIFLYFLLGTPAPSSRDTCTWMEEEEEKEDGIKGSEPLRDVQ